MFSLFLVEVYKYSKYQMCILNANTVSYTQVKSHKYKSDQLYNCYVEKQKNTRLEFVTILQIVWYSVQYDIW